MNAPEDGDDYDSCDFPWCRQRSIWAEGTAALPACTGHVIHRNEIHKKAQATKDSSSTDLHSVPPDGAGCGDDHRVPTDTGED